MKLYTKDEAIAALQNYKKEIDFTLSCLEAIDENMKVYIPSLETHSEFSNEMSKVCIVTGCENKRIETFAMIDGTLIAAERLNDKHTIIDDDGNDVNVMEIFTV